MNVIVYHLTKRSENRKTGSIAVTMSAKQTCPQTCVWKGKSCYAGLGVLNIHWTKVNKGKMGTSFNEHVKEILGLPEGKLVRFNQAGDLPGNGRRLFNQQTSTLLKSGSTNRKRAWAYTHYLDDRSLTFFKTLRGSSYATVNLSADSPSHADKLAKANLPMVCLIPKLDKIQFTPRGRRIVRCPAEHQNWTTCQSCGSGKPLCWRKDRDYIIGFYPHGVGKKRMLLEVQNAS